MWAFCQRPSSTAHNVTNAQGHGVLKMSRCGLAEEERATKLAAAMMGRSFGRSFYANTRSSWQACLEGGRLWRCFVEMIILSPYCDVESQDLG